MTANVVYRASTRVDAGDAVPELWLIGWGEELITLGGHQGVATLALSPGM